MHQFFQVNALVIESYSKLTEGPQLSTTWNH
jgi:hypothetical protein